MKSFMQFFTDGAIITFVMGLIVAAFLVTSALSPIKFEESSFAVSDTQSVLGKAHLGEFQFEPIQDSSTDIKITQLHSDKSGIKFSLQFYKLNEPVKVKLLRVANSTSENRTLYFDARSPESIEKNLVVTLQAEKFENKLDLNASEDTAQILQSGQTVEYEVLLNPSTQINFASEIILEFCSE